MTDYRSFVGMLNNQTATNTKPEKSPKQFKSNRPLKILNINFRSIKNKKPDLDILLDSVQPDIIIGTETWLDPSVTSSEFSHRTTSQSIETTDLKTREDKVMVES